MDWKGWKQMEWKEVLSVSIIIGVISPYLTFVLESYGDAALLIVNPLLGIIATGLVLNKKLSNKSAWGILIGMIITGVVYLFINNFLNYLIT